MTHTFELLSNLGTPTNRIIAFRVEPAVDDHYSLLLVRSGSVPARDRFKLAHIASDGFRIEVQAPAALVLEAVRQSVAPESPFTGTWFLVRKETEHPRQSLALFADSPAMAARAWLIEEDRRGVHHGDTDVRVLVTNQEGDERPYLVSSRKSTIYTAHEEGDEFYDREDFELTV